MEHPRATTGDEGDFNIDAAFAAFATEYQANIGVSEATMNAMQNFSDLVSYATAETHFVDVASIAASGAEAETSIEPVKKRRRVDNTDSEELVMDSSPYIPDPFPLNHRFYGLLRVPRMINGRKDKEEDDLLKANRARVKHMFLDDLRPRVLSAKLTEKTAIDSATLATSMWQYLGVDLWEDNPLGRWLWSYPDPKFTNSVLKALNQVLGAHKHREDKFNGILGKLWDKFIEFNVNSEEEDVVYLTSGDIYRLFGIKTKKQKEDALALQADVHTLEDAGSLPERMFHVPESQLRAMRDAFSSQQHLFSEHMNYIDSLLNSVGDDQELPVTSN